MQRLSEATNSASPSVCARAMLDGLPQVMWHIRRHMRNHRQHGLSIPAFRTLVLLDRFPSASLSLIADNLGASLPTASRIVTGLVRKGMVRRAVSSQDRRQVALVLSAKGREGLNFARKQSQDEIAGRLAGLTPGQRGTIVESMRHLIDVFGSHLDAEEAPVAAGD
jgi:DNA-binding MarR family transcriptional regulator